MVACGLSALLWLSCLPSPAAVIVQLRVIEGEGAVHQVGSRSKTPLTVLVTDENGKPVEGATVSFRLPESGPSGTFGGGLRTELATTHADGRATVWGMQWNKTPGPFEIRITAVREQARAGIVSAQFLSDGSRPSTIGTGIPPPGSTEPGPPHPGSTQSGGTGTFGKPHSSRKWLIVAAIAAGAGGAGLAFGRQSKSAPTVAPTAPTQIGAPTIKIGAPK